MMEELFLPTGWAFTYRMEDDSILWRLASHMKYWLREYPEHDLNTPWKVNVPRT